MLLIASPEPSVASRAVFYRNREASNTAALDGNRRSKLFVSFVLLDLHLRGALHIRRMRSWSVVRWRSYSRLERMFVISRRSWFHHVCVAICLSPNFVVNPKYTCLWLICFLIFFGKNSKILTFMRQSPSKRRFSRRRAVSSGVHTVEVLPDLASASQPLSVLQCRMYVSLMLEVVYGGAENTVRTETFRTAPLHLGMWHSVARSFWNLFPYFPHFQVTRTTLCCSLICLSSALSARNNTLLFWHAQAWYTLDIDAWCLQW